MLLTISTTHRPATDLGYLLHKNPARLHMVELNFGRALIAYPEASDERCTFALGVEVDPIALVRGKGAGEGLLDQYVNDRPYAASSFLSVALSRALGAAMSGRSKHRAELSEQVLPLEATVTPLAARGREGVAESLFAPLGYSVEAVPHPLDPDLPDWGDSAFVTLHLRGTVRLRDLLAHLYVLVPVLDNSKHYFISSDEVDKLLAKGKGWLETHPEKDLIVTRYLTRRKTLIREALARLADGAADEEEAVHEARDEQEQSLEKPIRLNDQRMTAVASALIESGARSVVDLGCGDGRLMRELLQHRQFTTIAGIDTSLRALEIAERRLKIDRMTPRQRGRVALLHGALTYRDNRLAHYDAAALVEVIEHLDAERLPALERVVFEFARPATIVVTTPNREYNALFEGMAPGAMRHADHRFEWDRAEFETWARAVAARHGYSVSFLPVGEVHETWGPPTQMAVFARSEGT